MNVENLTSSKDPDTGHVTRGGNIAIKAGAGATPALDGAIIFQLGDGSEFMRVEAAGSVFVKGDKVAADVTVYRALKEFLAHAGCYPDPAREL